MPWGLGTVIQEQPIQVLQEKLRSTKILRPWTSSRRLEPGCSHSPSVSVGLSSKADNNLLSNLKHGKHVSQHPSPPSRKWRDHPSLRRRQDNQRYPKDAVVRDNYTFDNVCISNSTLNTRSNLETQQLDNASCTTASLRTAFHWTRSWNTGKITDRPSPCTDSR